MDISLFCIIMFIFWFVIGVIAGIIVGKSLFFPKSLGNLRIKESDEKGEHYLFLELDEKPDNIFDKKYVTFKVVTEKHASQK